MQGAKDLIASERGWFCLALLLAGTILAALKIITGADWISLAKWLALALVSGKTASGIADRVMGDTSTTPAPGGTT